MTKYIDADRLRAEIENLIERYSSIKAKGILQEGYKGGRLIGYEDALNKLDSLQHEQPSLPSDLDEAARKAALMPELVGVDEEHLDEYPYSPIAEQKFKEGAEWMVGQGYTRECTVDRTPLNGPAGIYMNLHDSTGFKIGDKVIVQIRKKD